MSCSGDLHFYSILGSLDQRHRSLWLLSGGLEFGIYKDPRLAPASVHLVFCVLNAFDTGLVLVVKLKRNVVMMRACVKKLIKSCATPVKLLTEKRYSLVL